MKKIIRASFVLLLGIVTRGIVRKYQPRIVMVTGSVGKTSTKDAVAAVLAQSFYIRASEKSFNSEFGVPLTIIGAANPWLHPVGWVKVFIEAFALLLFPNHYPKVLVLEVGADRPGDLARILKIATPNAVVVTRLPKVPVHVEAYVTPAAVREEEFAPAYALAPDSPLILSADDEYACALAAPLAARQSTYGESEGAAVRIGKELPFIEQGRLMGMMAEVSIAGVMYPFTVRGTIGRPQLLAPAAAIALGLSLGMGVKDTLKGVEGYIPPPGRGRLISGLHDSCLIDDSYNASPAAVEEALDSLEIAHTALKGSRRIAVLGDMLELGRYSHQEHERIGRIAARKCDVLVTVGIRSRATAEAAIAQGMDARLVQVFENSREAREFLKPFIQKSDIVLVKGSQSVRMERIMEALLLNPQDRLHLVRQDTEWKKR